MRRDGGEAVSGEWRCHVVDDFARDGHRVTIYRRMGDAIEVVSGFDPDDGLPIFADQEPNVQPEEPPLFFSRGMLEAIAEAVKPGPSRAEFARLEEALRVERARVDQVLDRRVT